jgi:hypothetical protein
MQGVLAKARLMLQVQLWREPSAAHMQPCCLLCAPGCVCQQRECVRTHACSLGSATSSGRSQTVMQACVVCLTDIAGAAWCGLQNGAGAGDRIGGAPAFPWPKPDKPMMFWAQLGPEEISASGELVARS